MPTDRERAATLSRFLTSVDAVIDRRVAEDRDPHWGEVLKDAVERSIELLGQTANWQDFSEQSEKGIEWPTR